MKIRLSVAVSKDKNSLLQPVYRDVDWPAVPRVDDSVEIVPDSRYGYVRSVCFEFKGTVHIQMTNIYDLDVNELKKHGWKV